LCLEKRRFMEVLPPFIVLHGLLPTSSCIDMALLLS
jgi:hypothetical protein